MRGLAERHPVQHVGPAARRQRTDDEAGERADCLVEGLRSFDALGDRGRLREAKRGPRCPQRLVTGELTHARDVPRQAAAVTPASAQEAVADV